MVLLAWRRVEGECLSPTVRASALTCPRAQHQVQRRLLLDAVVRQRAAVLSCLRQRSGAPGQASENARLDVDLLREVKRG